MSHNTVKVVLVHGVGNPQLSELKNLTLMPMAEAGVQVENIYEFNWNSKVAKPFSEGGGVFEWLNTSYVASIGRSTLNAILIPFSAPKSSWQSIITRSCEYLAIPLQASPLAFLWLPLLWFKSTRKIEELICAVFVTVCALIVFLGLLSGEKTILMQAVRVALLPILWIAIFFAGVPTNVSWPLLLAIGVCLLAIPVAVSLPQWASPFRKQDPDPNSIPGTPMDMATGVSMPLTLWAIPYLMVGIPLWFLLASIVHKALEVIFFAPLKILADVVLYLGDDEYRRSLIDALAAELLALSDQDTDLILVTHSLGTVIAADTLREIVGLRSSQVTFITAGSPLTRLFNRFFPARYPDVKCLLRQFEASVPNFRWINVYRPFDPIGGSLGLPAQCEVSTKQKFKLLMGAHSNYWSDPVPYVLITPLLTTIKTGGAEINVLSEASKPDFSVNFASLAASIRRKSMESTIVGFAVAMMCSWIIYHRREIYDVVSSVVIDGWNFTLQLRWFAPLFILYLLFAGFMMGYAIIMAVVFFSALILENPLASTAYSLFGIENPWIAGGLFSGLRKKK
jgi:hypothetical protein